ncbi:MAG TPA: NUDIX domain-containing protein [Pyrinomonadaceae bacterium]|jgi:ADP-ribose pyrophosphatase YjhB (NUDIX family)|nr:NUDIX domain-containing protein [Pyrinomonadaceae bacterium]
MLKKLLGALWRGAPKSLRRWSVRLVEPRFTVTAGAVVLDAGGRVLLLEHVFRMGSGWGIPGGFLKRGEQPEDAVRRELREEVGLEVDEVVLAFVRTLKKTGQVEIIFRCRARRAETESHSLEIRRTQWFALSELPESLARDQRRIIDRALSQRT